VTRKLSKVRDRRPELEGVRNVTGRNLRRKRRIKVAELHRRHPALMDGAPLGGRDRRTPTKVSAVPADVPRAAPPAVVKKKSKKTKPAAE